ncbi:MAG: PTS system mannose/fructose/N-acetylgalactosamine-transporter subunit IIB [Lactobacillaceae bacterium]
MSIAMARIDNRLLHGIIVTQWAPISHAHRVMVIDDQVANDDIAKASMWLARPTGMAISIISQATALSHFTQGQYDREAVFLIAKEPEIFLNLSNQGVKIPKITIGSTNFKDHATKLAPRVFATNQNLTTYHQLLALGIKIEIQFVPADKPIDLKDKLR